MISKFTFAAMNKIKAILVDDESSARDVLSNLLVRFCPNVEVVATSENVEQAVGKINELNPDLVFLDIEMPQYAGFEIVRFFENINFQIIFVTAYEHYAIRAFEIAAVDYLLKPIDIDRLKQAVARAEKKVILEQQEQRLQLVSENLESKQFSNLVINDRGNQHVIPFSEIIAFEAMESYSCIHTTKRNFTVSKNLKYYENLLEQLPQFFRTHKSWLINTSFVTKYNKSEMLIQLDNIQAKLSKYKKADFETLIGQK